MPQPELVFLDASVLVAASGSAEGGSAVAMELCQGGQYRAALTTTVLLEARWNIAGKLGEPALLRFYRQLAALGPEMVAPPGAEQISRYMPLTGVKHAHVLAAALRCDAAYLLTLDRRHLLTPAVESAGLPVQVMAPGDFLRDVVIRGE